MIPRAGWEPWLARLQSSPGGLHGSTLVDAMIDHAAGRWYVGPSDADDALNEAEREGLITRGAWSPTHSQRACLGLTYGRKPDKHTRRFHASHWTWFAKGAGA